ncbi:MerR family transcriptional regulator [Streptomyces sp. NPDC004111]|uniref:helix-turn-helix domain-containing protein n=1 Tax=Streptomyces sp. NPDC004111 TaxID=3364690 RepID=UPI003696C471
MNGNDTSLCSIGDLSRLTGLPVRTIRFYSDSGIVTPAVRSPAGYRRYGKDAVVRLGLVRTLRELGIDLPAIRKVMDREVALPEVAAVHAEALDVQIHHLRLRRALLTVVAERGSTPEELDLMFRLAQLSEEERTRLIGDFLDSVFDGLRSHPAFSAVTRSMTPELPDHPEPEQLTAWVELAQLCQDPEFRDSMRGMAENLATDRITETATGIPLVLAAAVRSLVEPALADGIAPASPEAAPVIALLTAHYAKITGAPDDPALRVRLAAHLESMNDPRRDHYLHLLALINGWPPPDTMAPVLDWAVRALRAEGR